MIPSIVNPKVIHRATQAVVNPYETALDSGMEFIEPETPEPTYWGNNKGCFEESAVRKTNGLARSEKKFGVQVIGVLDKKRVNGYYRCSLLCLDGSTLEDDVSEEELEAFPELRKTSAIEEWEKGGYPIDPPIELALFKEENKDKLASCVLCERILLHPKSAERHICPECFPKINLHGLTFVDGETVAHGLIRASQAYAEERFQKMIIKAVLLLDAPVPDATLEWKGKGNFGYDHKPALYYTDADGKLNCLEVKKRKLTHRYVTDATLQNDLDRYAWDMIQAGDIEESEATKEAPRPIEIKEVILHGPYFKGEWFIKEGNRCIGVYREINNKLWCNCRDRNPNCRHIQAVRTQFRIPDSVNREESATGMPQNADNNHDDDGDNPPSSCPEQLATEIELIRQSAMQSAGVAVSNFPREIIERKVMTMPPLQEDIEENTTDVKVDVEITGVSKTQMTIRCTICSKKLTAPESRSWQIGPECRKKLGITGPSHLQDDNVISDALLDASKFYHDDAHRKRIIKACLTLDAPLPTKVLKWQGNQYWSYKKSPILYYLDIDGQLHRLDTYKRKLRHKVVTKETSETELDSHALRLVLERSEGIASETNGNGNGNGGRKCLQMDRNLRTWLIEAEGTKKEISCREICEQFEDSSLVTRLRQGIDSGVDISTVEVN